MRSQRKEVPTSRHDAEPAPPPSHASDVAPSLLAIAMRASSTTGTTPIVDRSKLTLDE